MVILSVSDLHIEFHDHASPEVAVDDFDLELSEGEIVGIVGESGSGKSMSALAIAGLLSRHDMTKSGRIMFDGHDLLTCDRTTLRSYQGDEISIIFQEPNTSLNPVQKNRMADRRKSSYTSSGYRIKKQRKKMAIDILEDVGLHSPEKVYDMYPHELSGGMKQRGYDSCRNDWQSKDSYS